MRSFIKLIIAVLFCSLFSLAQQTNPVDRQVANPLTDTPNVNPVAESTPVTNKKKPSKKEEANKKDDVKDEVVEGGDDEVVVYSNKRTIEGKEGERILVHTGNVDARYGEYRMQADKITVIEAKNLFIAEGNVIFDQGNDQRITGTKAEWNYKTKLGYFVDSTGFTNQTSDGTIIYWTADRVERISTDTIKVLNGKFTACEDAKPQWSFTSKEAVVISKKSVKLKNTKFRVLDVPIATLPYISIPLKKDDRKSGFLTPTVGFSANKGFRFSGAYYQTLGRSGDVTFRGDYYSSRGIGYGADFRFRTNSRSYLNFGFYAVKDRMFVHKVDAAHPDQGGSTVYAEGVQFFNNGWTAAVDVRLTSSLAFRQVFSDGIQQIISPIEVSKAFINKSWGDYSFNLLGKSEVISIPNLRVKTRNLPSVNFEKRPSPLPFTKNIYFSFKTSFDAVSRRESVDDLKIYRDLVGSDPINTPIFGQRFDINPEISVPITTKYATITATAGFRATYYSDSLDGLRRVVGQNILRSYGEFQLDIQPVALAKNFYRANNSFRFRHVIEPYLVYRFRTGVNNFNRIIRFDYTDTISDTNEVEWGITNRIFTRKYTEAVTEEAKELLSKQPSDEKNPLSIQPYELFTFTVRQKHFFDPYFGGALVPGKRNQITPITQLTAFTFGGIPRRWSPLNVDATYRPRKTIFVNIRSDIGVQGDGLRDVSATIGYDTRLFKLFQTFYYTRAVDLIPSLQQFNNAFGKEAGTLRGSQWNPSFFIGDRNKGWYGGASLFFDFQNRRATQTTPLISSLATVGYAYDCCAVTFQAYTFNVGIRRENKYVFSFRLNGIGTFGTEQFGQGLR
jgi:LPS-assembly protein